MTVVPEEFVYDEAYFRHGFGPEPYQRGPHWMRFFNGIADEIVHSLTPKRVLDAGCAIGMLVEALRERGVDAWGIDVSDYAISSVPPELRPFCRLGSIADPIEGRYDLVTCIEVLEHLRPDDTLDALRTLTGRADTILFSSTPDDFQEPSHINIRPIREWLQLFSDFGFEPDIRYDAGFVCAHAILLRRQAPLSEAVVDLFAKHLTLRAELARRDRLAQASTIDQRPEGTTGISALVDHVTTSSEAALRDELRRAENQAAMLKAHSDAVIASPGWQIVSAYRNWLHTYIWPRRQVRRFYEPLVQGLVRRFGAKLAGSASAKSPPTRVPPAPIVSAGDPFAEEQEIRLHWDGPTADQRVRGLIEIWGWAAAESGIRAIEVSIDNETTLPAEYGMPRPDVLKHVPALPGGLKPGFRLWWDTTAWPPGVHRVRITAVSGEDRVSVERVFLVDQRDEYEVWQQLSEPSHADKQAMRRRIEDFADRPKISMITPVYKSDLRHLVLCVSSMRSQIYPNWELCLADDGSADAELTEYLESLPKQDRRIKLVTLPENRGIGAATNAALEIATGDFVAFLDHDDVIQDFALYETVLAINANPTIDVIYSDEDKLDDEGKRFFPFFKPDWSPDLLRCCNYVCHFLVARRELVERVGRVRSEFDGSQDYDLILRLTEATDQIHHIPKVLYHWRSSARSAASSPDAKPEASQAGVRALKEHLRRKNLPAQVFEIGASRYHVRYEMEEEKKVAIIIPTGGNISRLNEALSTVLLKTTYSNYEIILVDNSSDDRVAEFLTSFQTARQRPRRLDKRGAPFNFSKLCNDAVSETDAEYLVFLNDDVSVITPDWLGVMTEHLQRQEVGAVGALLRYPDDLIQHAGIILGLFNTCGQAFRGLHDGACYMGLQGLTRNVSAVTGACLLVRRSDFLALNGFDEVNLPLAYQDVDLCLRLHEKGYLTVYTPYAELYHAESASKSESEKIAGYPEIEYLRKRWHEYMAHDPYYSPNLTRESESYGFRLEIGAPNTAST